MTPGMSPIGRSAIPTDSPSSTQKPVPKCAVRTITDTAASSPSATGASTGARARLPARGHRIGTAVTAIAGRLGTARAAQHPAGGGGGGREPGVVGQGGPAHGDRHAGGEREDVDVLEVAVQLPRDGGDLEAPGVDRSARVDCA